MVDRTLPTGARLDGKDERSRAYRARKAERVHSIRHKHYGPVLDQSIGSCTGHSNVQNQNCKPNHKPGSRTNGLLHDSRYLTEDDAMAVYSRATTIDPWPGNWPPTDTGSSVTAAANAAKQLGLITSFEWAFGYAEFQAALMLKPVNVGTFWTDSMFNPNSKGFIEVHGSFGDMGHAWNVTAYSSRFDYYTMLNNWGLWGLRGFARISGPDMRRLIEADGEATVLTV